MRVSAYLRVIALAMALAAGRNPLLASDPPTDSAPSSSIANAQLPKPTVASVPLKGAGAMGGDVGMVTQVFVPAGGSRVPVVIFSHGRAGDAVGRSRLATPVSGAQVRYWLGLGFAVVAPIRPGYGDTGGTDAEANFAGFDSNSGACNKRPDYRRAANASKQTVTATLDWLRTQPWADARRVILVGQSAGGLATVAAAAEQPDGVVGYVNFAGGNGGNPQRSPGKSCDPQQLTEIYSELGKKTKIPNLWVYAENDQYFGSEVPVEWHAAFALGGSPSTFVHAPPVSDGDGHGLSRHPSALWAPYLDPFVRSIGLQTPSDARPTQMITP